MDEDTIPVVVSLGSLVSRVGHCKADLPQLLPSVIGYLHHVLNLNLYNYFVILIENRQS